MSITITTHPVSKTQPQKVIGIVQQGWIKPNLSPGFTETLIQGRQHIGEDVTQVVQDVVEFLLQSWFFKVDLTGAPEALEDRDDFLADALMLTGSPHLIFSPEQ